MGVSKLSDKCRKCPKKNECNHKKMEALAYLEPCGQSSGVNASQPLARETMQINVGGVIQIVYKDDIEKANDDDNDVSLAEQVAQLKVQNAKLKKANDKATSEAASYKKQLREKQTAEEIALQEKAEKEAEREEQFQKLLRENTITKFEKNFLTLGYPADLAAKAATAQCDNDTDELFSIQQTFIEEKEKTMKADWMKSMPNPPAGNSDDDEDAFLKGFNM